MRFYSILSVLLVGYFLLSMSPCSQKAISDQGVIVDDQHPAAPLYAMYCAGCHGRKLEKFQDKPWMQTGSIESVVQSIRYGIVDAGMPSFEATFTEDEINSLADYIIKGIPSDKSQLKAYDVTNKVVQSEKQRYAVDVVATGFDVPWGMAFLPGGDLLITDRGGNMYRYSAGVLSAPIKGVPDVTARNQGGLLDIVLHPNYATNGWIYFSYSKPDDQDKSKSSTAIMRAKLDGDQLVNQELIFEAFPKTKAHHHYGSKLVFDQEGYLYFGVGDRGDHFVFPQKLDNHHGKVHRIKDDGSIPQDNPFVNTSGAMPSIYSYGHRNPQGTTMHPLTGRIWESEHGPKGGDELNLIAPGVNYGWPVISYGINYNGTILTELTEKEGMEQPVFYWVPSIAPCGMTFVTGDKYPGWKHNLLLGSLSFEYLERVELEVEKVVHREKLLQDIGRVRNVVMGPDGYIYVGVESPGRILRILPL
jgi:glucose/arabinose dehydrogenase